MDRSKKKKFSCYDAAQTKCRNDLCNEPEYDPRSFCYNILAKPENVCGKKFCKKTPQKDNKMVCRAREKCKMKKNLGEKSIPNELSISEKSEQEEVENTEGTAELFEYFMENLEAGANICHCCGCLVCSCNLRGLTDEQMAELRRQGLLKRGIGLKSTEDEIKEEKEEDDEKSKATMYSFSYDDIYESGMKRIKVSKHKEKKKMVEKSEKRPERELGEVLEQPVEMKAVPDRKPDILGKASDFYGDEQAQDLVDVKNVVGAIGDRVSEWLAEGKNGKDYEWEEYRAAEWAFVRSQDVPSVSVQTTMDMMGKNIPSGIVRDPRSTKAVSQKNVTPSISVKTTKSNARRSVASRVSEKNTTSTAMPSVGGAKSSAKSAADLKKIGTPDIPVLIARTTKASDANANLRNDVTPNVSIGGAGDVENATALNTSLGGPESTAIREVGSGEDISVRNAGKDLGKNTTPNILKDAAGTVNITPDIFVMSAGSTTVSEAHLGKKVTADVSGTAMSVPAGGKNFAPRYSVRKADNTAKPEVKLGEKPFDSTWLNEDERLDTREAEFAKTENPPEDTSTPSNKTTNEIAVESSDSSESDSSTHSEDEEANEVGTDEKFSTKEAPQKPKHSQKQIEKICKCLPGYCTCADKHYIFKKKKNEIFGSGFKSMQIDKMYKKDKEEASSTSCICIHSDGDLRATPKISRVEVAAFPSPSKTTKRIKYTMYHPPKYQKTLIIIKPDAVKFKDVILRAIKKEGLDVLDERIIRLSPEQVIEIYSENYGSPYFNLFVKKMSSFPILVFCVGGIDAITVWNKAVGPNRDIPNSWFFPPSVKRRFGIHRDVFNVMKTSDDFEGAKTEIKYFFPLNIIEPITIKSVEVQDYCNKNIHPTLLKGLYKLIEKKPADPLLFLAEWLLVNNPFQPFYKQIHVALAPT